MSTLLITPESHELGCKRVKIDKVQNSREAKLL